jgi:hypothetical protein
MSRIEKLCSDWMGGQNEVSLEIEQFSYHPPVGAIAVQHAGVNGSLKLSDGGRFASISGFDVVRDSFDVPSEYILGVLKYYVNQKDGKFKVDNFNDNGSSVALYCFGPIPFTNATFTFHCKRSKEKDKK